MVYLNLPVSTKVGKVVPKNAFDNYTNTKQKKIFTDKVGRITWANKLSKETTNLEPKEIQEIQVFKIELKVKEDIQVVLDIIDKSIPYPIIFAVEYHNELYFSCSTKHPHPVNEDNSVIDWTFKTEWFNQKEELYSLNLKKDLDFIFKDFCVQLSGKTALEENSLGSIVDHERAVTLLKKEIAKLKSTMSKLKQFNKKLELNNELNNKKQELKKLMDKV
jgi:hypothetical protein